MRGYPFQKIFYQLTHVEDFSGLFLFLAGVLILVILIGIYFLIFKGLKHFVNKKVAGILSAIILIIGAVTMYHYNRDYITEAYNIIKEAGRWPSVRKTRMPEGPRAKAVHFPKGSTAEKILGEINSAKTSEELDVIKAKMEANPELKNKKEVLTKLQESAAAKKLEFDNIVANQKRKAEQAEKARQDREAMHAKATAKLSEKIRNGEDLNEHDRFVISKSNKYREDIDFRNKNHPDKQLDYEGSPVEPAHQPASAPEAAKPATEANPGEGAESLSEEMLKGPEPTATGKQEVAMPATEAVPKANTATGPGTPPPKLDVEHIPVGSANYNPRIGITSPAGKQILNLVDFSKVKTPESFARFKDLYLRSLLKEVPANERAAIQDIINDAGNKVRKTQGPGIDVLDSQPLPPKTTWMDEVINKLKREPKQKEAVPPEPIKTKMDPDGQIAFDWYSKPRDPVAFMKKLLKRSPKAEEVERIPDQPDQLKFDFMEEPVVANSTKKPKGQGVMNKNFWDRTMARLRANAEAEAKAQAKTNAKAKERLLKEYGPEEGFEFNAKPRAEQAPKVEPGPKTTNEAVPPNTGQQANAQAPKSNFNAFMKTVLDPKANAKDAFRLGKGIVWDPVFHPIKTVGRAIGGALGTAAAATEMNIAANQLTNKQPVGLVDMFTNLPQALLNRIRRKDDKNPEWTRKVMIPSQDNPNGSGATGEDGKTTSSETDTAANEEQKQNKNQGTVVTSWLPESFKNISVNDYPVGGSLFGALAGGALGAGFGGLNYILTDENELSEEEKKKRSLARAMLSSAGIGASIGGAIGGLDDWGRAAATPKKT